ncbi:MAG: ADP-ribosyl-[dinitrogen reductase] hydrolase [Gammaproteobacteria bacterium]|nr:ADP-ribosyl-[dinitrogen reductase] hydrolase [Gammaproteobacteria bacterium]
MMRARAAYAGLAIGDALGATVEFMTSREIEHRYGIHRDIIGGGWLCLVKGEVTDDTEMSLALGNSILLHGGVNSRAAARAFSDWMRGKPRDVGNTVRRGIIHFRNTGESELAPNDMDAGNGSCMRCLPVALCTLGAKKEQVVYASRQQAHVTHNSCLADAGTECVIDLVQLALTNTSKDALVDRIDNLVTDYSEFRFRNRNISNPSGYIVDTLQVVFEAFIRTTRFESCLIDVVNQGGDADTAAAIAGMISGAFYGMDQIPEIWLTAINRSILDTCLQQAESLIKISPLFMEATGKVVDD